MARNVSDPDRPRGKTIISAGPAQRILYYYDIAVKLMCKPRAGHSIPVAELVFGIRLYAEQAPDSDRNPSCAGNTVYTVLTRADDRTILYSLPRASNPREIRTINTNVILYCVRWILLSIWTGVRITCFLVAGFRILRRRRVKHYCYQSPGYFNNGIWSLTLSRRIANFRYYSCLRKSV